MNAHIELTVWMDIDIDGKSDISEFASHLDCKFEDTTGNVTINAFEVIDSEQVFPN